MIKKRQPNAKFMQPMKVSEALADVVGKGPMPRTEVTKKLWAYIKSHNLQDKANKRNIIPDDKLSKVFGGKKKAVNMFEMTKLVNAHLS
jgi:chromatin remodeling complex protein RSC6